MLISRTSQYAIQALIYIALKEAGTPILSREVAEQLGVPAAYLAKIMQTLCKGGLLTSFRDGWVVSPCVSHPRIST